MRAVLIAFSFFFLTGMSLTVCSLAGDARVVRVSRAVGVEIIAFFKRQTLYTAQTLLK